MHKLLSNLLAGTFGVIAGTVSVASLPMCAGSALLPGSYAAAAWLALVYQSLSGKRADAELEDKLNALVYDLTTRRRDMLELIRAADLPTDGVGSEETPLRMLYEALRREIQANALDPAEIEKRLTRLLEKNEGLAQRLIATLLDETNGLRQSLANHDAEVGNQFQRLAGMLRDGHDILADELCARLFYPRLSLPLHGYSLNDSAAHRLFHGCRRVPLVGREQYLERLHAFLRPREGAVPDVQWWLWTGPAGMGKSRLALELCLQAIELGYQTGFWDRNDPFQDWDKWMVHHPTLVVVDYLAERATSIRDGVLRLLRHPANIRQHLRLLLLERSADEEIDPWYREFRSARSTRDRIDLDKCCYGDPFICAGLDDQAISTILSQILSERGFTASLQEVLAAYRQIDNEGRPLLAAAAAEAIAHGGSIGHIRNWSAADLVQAIGKREVDAWRAAGIDEAHGNLLAYATIRSGCRTSSCDELASQGMSVPSSRTRNDRWLRQMSAFSTDPEPDEIPPLAPDMLGEWFVLERLAGRIDFNAPNRQLVCEESLKLLKFAWETDPSVERFILRTVEDFGAHQATSLLFSEVLARSRAGTFAILVGYAVPSLMHAGRAELTRRLLQQLAGLIAASSDPLVPVGLSTAWYNRGVTYSRMGDKHAAIADFTSAIELPGAPADLVADALTGRGFAYANLGDVDHAIRDFGRVLELSHAAPAQIAKALNNRGVVYAGLGDSEREIAIEDFTRVIELPAAPPDQVAEAFYNRGRTYAQMGDSKRAIADYNRAVELPGARTDQVAKALYNRGVRHDMLDKTRTAIEDYTGVIELPAAHPRWIAYALNNRGVAQARIGDSEAATADYSRVIELVGAPMDQVTLARINRAGRYGKLGETERAMADYAHVLELSNAPPAQVAQALLGTAVFGNFETNERCKRLSEAQVLAENAGEDELLLRIRSVSRSFGCS